MAPRSRSSSHQYSTSIFSSPSSDPGRISPASDPLTNMDIFPQGSAFEYLPFHPFIFPQPNGLYDVVLPQIHPQELSFSFQPPFYGLLISPLKENIPPINENMPPDMKFETAREERLDSIQALALPSTISPNSTVNIIVESDGKSQKFTCHRDLLRYYSPYFRDLLKQRPDQIEKKVTIKSHMLKREWRWEDASNVEAIIEGIAGMGEQDGKVEVEVKVKIKLPPPTTICDIRLDHAKVGDVKRMVFAAFVEWLYRGSEGFGLDPNSERQIDATTLIQLWVFAGKTGVPACQNACIEAIELWRQNSGIIQTSALAWVYQNTKEWEQGRCSLKKLLIDQCAWKLDGKWMESGEMLSEEMFPKLALLDLAARMRQLLSSDSDGIRGKPPFAILEWRKKLYWEDVGEKQAKK